MQFDQFLRCLGLIPRDIIPGKWIRCATETHPRKRNGCYKLAESGTIGWAIDWATMSESETWRPERDQTYKVDHKAIERDRLLRNQEEAKAIQAAKAYWNACKPLSHLHPYLESKGFDAPCMGLRIDHKGNLVIPMGRSLQRINEDGEKLFWPGAPTKGAKFVIDRTNAPLTIYAEGLATGLTLFNAVPNSRVVVTFNAGNMPVVATEVRYKGMSVVCADNDHKTFLKIGKNPGVDSARKAAEILGCGVAIPDCDGSDWNDYFCEKLAEKKSQSFLRRTPVSDHIKAINGDICRQVMKQASFISYQHR